MAIKISRYDGAFHLDTEEEILAYLKVAFEEGDADDIRAALNNVARARGMTQVSRDTGVAREALYKALGSGGNPTLTTLLSVMRSLGVKLSVAA
jgi:probable addiction module antidote protein